MRSAQCCVAVGGDSPEALRALELFRKVASPAAVQVIEDFMAGRTTEAHPADAPRTLDEFLLAELHRPAKRGEGDRLVPTGPFVTEWQAFARGAMWVRIERLSSPARGRSGKRLAARRIVRSRWLWIMTRIPLPLSWSMAW